MQCRRFAAKCDSAVTKYDDAAVGCDDAAARCDYAMAKCVLVPTGRHVVAMGVSPWYRGNRP
jgi:ABC-type antimicrobial peptide transport system ATPase subunit